MLADGVNTYVYGYTRLAQMSDADTGYFLTDALGSVRQVTDAAGAITLVREYSPYGETTQSLGSYETSYSYTGEITDASGLVYLRARYREFCAPERSARVGYDPAMGRFVNKDVFGGNNNDPSSNNRWSYVNANPINFVDPSGMWRWWAAEPMYHWPIEAFYERKLGFNPTRQLEFPIPGTPFRHPDIFNSLTGDVYEIEPFFLKSKAAPQASGYVADLLSAASIGKLAGYNYFGMPYDWNSTPFHLGSGIDWSAKYRMPLAGFPMADLVADYVSPGTVIYWIEPNALAAAPLPFLVPNKRLVRPQNWNPGQRVNQPVTAISFEEACGYGLVAVGGTIIVVTIVEDIFTLGLGIYDDVVTVPTGYYFINLGLHMAAFVPG